MVNRGPRPREAKRIRLLRASTVEDKYRRHKNKARIWRRALKKILKADAVTAQ